MNHRSLVALLLDKGADLEVSKPRTPLYYALSSGARDAAELLIERGAVVPVSNSLFHSAVRKGIGKAVDSMIAKGVDLLSQNSTGGTLLHSAAEGGLVTLTELMLAKGADVNSKDRYGRGPLHLAAMRGHSAVVEQLTRKGADRNSKTPQGATAHDLAKSAGHQDQCDWLAAQGAAVRDFTFLETPGDHCFGLPEPGRRAELFAPEIISSADELSGRSLSLLRGGRRPVDRRRNHQDIWPGLAARVHVSLHSPGPTTGTGWAPTRGPTDP